MSDLLHIKDMCWGSYERDNLNFKSGLLSSLDFDKEKSGDNQKKDSETWKVIIMPGFERMPEAEPPLKGE